MKTALARVPDLGEDALVLVEDNDPAVTAADVLASVLPPGPAQRFIADEELEALDELDAVGVIEAAVTLHAVLDKNGAPRRFPS